MLCHIQGSTYVRTSAPNCAFSPQCTTVPVERGNSDQSGDTLAVQSSQFRQISQNGDYQLRPHARHGTQQVLLFPPYRAVTQCLLQFLVYLHQFLLKPIDVKLNSLAYQRSGGVQLHPRLIAILPLVDSVGGKGSQWSKGRSNGRSSGGTLNREYTACKNSDNSYLTRGSPPTPVGGDHSMVGIVTMTR